MEIREYTKFRTDEILPLYTQVGWTAYTADMAALEHGFQNSLLILAAYEKDTLLGLIRVVGDGATVIDRYAHVRQIQLLTDNTPKTVAFYRSLGFLELSELGCCGFMRG